MPPTVSVSSNTPSMSVPDTPISSRSGRASSYSFLSSFCRTSAVLSFGTPTSAILCLRTPMCPMRILYSFNPRASIIEAAIDMTSASVSGVVLPISSAPNWKNSLYLPL